MKLRNVLYWIALTELCINSMHAQVYTEAPEKWSFPTKIKNVSNDSAITFTVASLTADEKTMYLCWGNRMLVSTHADTGWTYPIALNDSINTPGTLTEAPSISPEGKTLYFRRYVGEWRILYSKWNDSLKLWGTPQDMGFNINDGGGWYGMTPDNQHFFFFRVASIRESTWNDTTQEWGPAVQLDPYRFIGAYLGVSVTKNLHKIYYDSYGYNSDIFVHYYDTVTSTWSHPMLLNIDRWMDSTGGQHQQSPWISPDGRRLYFVSTYDGKVGIWESHLLIDENGNPVSVEETEPSRQQGYQLDQNYPNPFNSETRVDFRVRSFGFVSLKVFDVLGREVGSLVNDVKRPGEYTASWNASNQPSGVYFYRLNVSNSYSHTMKMILMR